MGTPAIYPGSFDPLTWGHHDLIVRAARMFEQVIVAVAEDTTGKRTLFSTEERVELIRASIPDLANVVVEPFSGLLVSYARRRGPRVLVRGIRAFSDFEYEFQMALLNRTMEPEIETVFLLPKEENSFVSSSWVREAAGLGGDVSSLVPAPVWRALTEKLGHGEMGGPE